MNLMSFYGSYGSSARWHPEENLQLSVKTVVRDVIKKVKHNTKSTRNKVLISMSVHYAFVGILLYFFLSTY